MSQTAYLDTCRFEYLGQIQGRSLALYRKVGGDNHLIDPALGNPGQQLVNVQGRRTNTRQIVASDGGRTVPALARCQRMASGP